MKNSFRFFAALVVILISLSAIAQSESEVMRLTQKLEGTFFVVPHRETADGVLTACGLEFTAMKRDFSTKNGAPTKIVGSFYLRPHDSFGLAYALKLGVFDGFSFENGLAPNNAFVSAPNGKIPPKAVRVLSDSPNFALFIGALDDAVTEAYRAILEKNILAVGFNRKPGQQDVTFLIDLTVVDTKMNGDAVVRERSSEPVAQFAACLRDLLHSVKNSIQ